ncbi:transmembrane O-methyltransferase-like isoform X1 [Lates japonicus]|uniref:catechol O-methyltransferase n=1 Tax=Lates japonicus TaxID=270547 RepID=A0AAD3RHC2_LATJO|nr:transmembrane O-methyltransferase-like isoform X1 [Lates japonicus]
MVLRFLTVFPTAVQMWLIAVSVPLLPAIIMVSGRYRVKVFKLYHRAVAWAQRMMRGRVCVKSTHAFVFSECIHGKVDSVLETFDLYAETHPSLCIGPEIGEALDEVVRRVRPSRVLELGMHCGYSSVRLLRLLPPAGRLITVELDPLTADLGEEIILVAGFKHSQFQVLTSSSAEAIPTLRSLLEPDQRTSEGFNLVLMDHDPQQYLPDLLALEKEALLCSSGCYVILINKRRRAEDLREILDHIKARADFCCIKTELQFMVEILYQREDTKAVKEQSLPPVRLVHQLEWAERKERGDS